LIGAGRFGLPCLSQVRTTHAVREMKADGLLPKDIKIRSSKYLNNLIGQDHRNIKSRLLLRLQCLAIRTQCCPDVEPHKRHNLLKMTV
jgi:hypothetical protein